MVSAIGKKNRPSVGHRDRKPIAGRALVRQRWRILALAVLSLCGQILRRYDFSQSMSVIENGRAANCFGFWPLHSRRRIHTSVERILRDGPRQRRDISWWSTASQSSNR